MLKILFLAANSSDMTWLNLAKEVRAIDQSLRKGALRDQIEIVHHWAVQASDLQELLLRHQPGIVHFSGHSSDNNEIILQTQSGQSHFVSSQSLSSLLSVLKDNIRCVVLNACCTEKQAEAIAEKIEYVVGMSDLITDDASIKFSTAFYRALGYGRDIPTAFKLGCLEINLENLNEHHVPKLLTSRILVNQSYRTLSMTGKGIESPYGTMTPNSLFYLEREADIHCMNYFRQGSPVTVHIQSPRQVGKSSLMQRICHLIKTDNYCDVVYVDFEKFTMSQFASLESFLIEFCFVVGDALNIPAAIDKYWSNKLRSELVRCSNYFANHIISSIEKPLVLAMDEVEKVIDAPFKNDFFGMLRSWHNDRAHDHNFARLSIFLSSSTEPHLFIDNPNQSPFNVGQSIELRDFSLDEVEELNKRHSNPLTAEQIIEITNLLGGHPFLTRLALYLISTQQYDFGLLRDTAISEDGPFQSHLTRFLHKIISSEDLNQALIQICRYQTYPLNKTYYRLKGAGLVKRVQDKVLLRNKLYHLFFAENLNV